MIIWKSIWFLASWSRSIW